MRFNLEKERGDEPVSRFGKATKFAFTCYFRGGKGETGGKGFQYVQSQLAQEREELEGTTSFKEYVDPDEITTTEV